MKFEKMDSILKAIGDENRLKIITLLLRDSYCGCEFVEILQLSQPAISQHLKRLRDAGITNEEKRGRWIYYSLNRNHECYPLILHLVSLLPPMDMKKNRMVCN